MVQVRDGSRLLSGPPPTAGLPGRVGCGPRDHLPCLRLWAYLWWEDVATGVGTGRGRRRGGDGGGDGEE